MYVCLFVCLLAAHLNIRTNFAKFLCVLPTAVALAARRCTSGFVDDVTLSHNSRMARQCDEHDQTLL